MSVNAKLSKLAASWKKAIPIAGGFDNLAEGDYIGDIKEIKLGESKKGRIQIELTWEVADGELAGKTQKQFYGLSDDHGTPDEKGMGYWKNVCEIIGLDLPEDLNLWQETLDEFVASSTSLFDITAKANGEYINVYVNGVSEYTKGIEEEAVVEGEEGTEEEVVEEEVLEEVTEEEVVEEVEEEVQEVKLPVKKIVAKVAAKPIAKVAAKVAPAKAAPAKAAPAKAVTQPMKKVVTLNRK